MTIHQRGTLYVDGFDMNRIGMGLSDVQGVWSGPSVRHETVSVPGIAGVRPVGLPILGPRTINISAVLECDTTAALRVAEQKLQSLTVAGLRMWRFRDRNDAQFECRTQSVVITRIHPKLAATQAQVEIELQCDSGFGVDTHATYIALSTTPAAIPLGPLPSTPVIRVMNANSITVTVRAPSGQSVATIGSSQALVTNEDYVKFDCENSRVRLFDQSVETSIYSLLSGDFFSLDPAWGSFKDSIWPTMETSAGTGEVVFRRVW